MLLGNKIFWGPWQVELRHSRNHGEGPWHDCDWGIVCDWSKWHQKAQPHPGRASEGHPGDICKHWSESNPLHVKNHDIVSGRLGEAEVTPAFAKVNTLIQERLEC